VRGPRAAIRRNRIFDNIFMGIDLLDGRGSQTITLNDPGDVDGGPNLRQNFPIITAATFSPGNTGVFGYLDSTPSTTFELEFFAGSACRLRPRLPVQGEFFAGAASVTTDASGKATFLVSLPYEVQAGQEITATATDPQGHTSEFSQPIIVATDPHSGPAEGGTVLTVTGMDFDANSQVTIDGLALGNPQTLDSWTITGTAPALNAGTIYGVSAFNPTLGGAATLPDAWLADFLDVPASNSFHDAVAAIVTNGIALGVGGGNFGVSAPTTRQQMAVFLMKAARGLCFVPPPCAGVFGDVPCASPFAPWIEALAAAGITGGCGGGNYCPTQPVRRDQMAAFLLKARLGPTYVPPQCGGLFADVACPSLFADWVEALANANITAGCGGGLYCPANPVLRGQMAAFVSKTFSIF
jgi:hypothetical protein